MDAPTSRGRERLAWPSRTSSAQRTAAGRDRRPAAGHRSSHPSDERRHEDWPLRLGRLATDAVVEHLTAAERAAACRELARTVRPGGWLLVSFHVDSDEFESGEVNRLTSWFGESVEPAGYFLDPADVVTDVESAGFALVATVQRPPFPEVEYPSRRCYVLAQRR